MSIIKREGVNVNYKIINNLIKYGGILLVSLISILILSKLGIFSLITKIFKTLIPVLFAVFLSFIMEPIILFFCRRKIKRQFSVLLSYLLLIIVLGLILLLILPSFINQLKVLINDLPNIIENLNNVINKFLSKIGIELKFSEMFNNSLRDMIPNVSKVVSSIFSLITVIGIVFIGSLYLSFDFQKCKNRIKRILPKKYKYEIISFIHKFEKFCYRYVYGILFDALILWILAGIGFGVLGLDYAIVFGFIVAIFDLIPYIGPIIGGAPAVIVALTIDLKFAIIVLAIVLIAQFIESNVTQPLILKSVISLHPLEGIIGILVLGVLFGFIGMVISPIVVTFIKLLLPYFRKYYQNNKFKKVES